MFRKFCICVIRLFFNLWFKIEVVNCDRFEKIKTGCVVTPNHISAWETLIVPAKTKRTMWIMAKEELFKNKIFAAFLKSMCVFSIARGKKDYMSLKKAITLARNGNAVCIFPEGTRREFNSKLKFKNGATIVACEAKVPVVPVGIVPKDNFKFRSKIYVVYGEPIYFYDSYDKKLEKEDLNKLTEQLEVAVQKAIDTGIEM